MDEPRSLEQRKADTLARLAAQDADTWVASADLSGRAHLVPLSYAWDGEQVILAAAPSAVTSRNIAASGRARLGFGHTRDVVMMDATLTQRMAMAEVADGVAERYARQADWDPREAGGDFVYLLMRPQRIQAWREVNELPGRTLMRDGAWLV